MGGKLAWRWAAVLFSYQHHHSPFYSPEEIVAALGQRCERGHEASLDAHRLGDSATGLPGARLSAFRAPLQRST
jgi:hypothetical protein